MVANEGARRIKTIGKTLALGGLASAVVLAVCMKALKVPSLSATPLLPFIFLILVAGGVFWVGGWVLEGFLGSRE